jgi:hypothetical protein
MASQESRTTALVEKIDDAIEQAEDLGLDLVAGILRMARLEVIQTDATKSAGRGNDEDS